MSPIGFDLREPQLQFKRKQIANIQLEMSSTSGFTLNRQVRLWVVFRQLPVLPLHCSASEDDSCLSTGADHSVPPSATPFPIPYKLGRSLHEAFSPPTAGKPDTTVG